MKKREKSVTKVRSLQDEVRVESNRAAWAGLKGHSIARCFSSGDKDSVELDFG